MDTVSITHRVGAPSNLTAGEVDDNFDVLRDELALAAPIASPTLTGTPAAPTAALGTNTTQLATTAFVQAAAAALVDSSPGTLDTLNELAAALGDDANFAATTAALLALKAPLDSPTFTGTPAAPTAAAATNTTQLATTAHVFAERANAATLTNKTLTSPAITTPTGIVKGDVGLGNVDNTSNVTERAAAATLTNKTLTTPVLNGAMTGTGTFVATHTMAATPSQADNSLKIATTAYVDTLGATKSDIGLVAINGTDITATRALTSADFDGAIRSINAAGVVAITVPTVATLGLASTPGKCRVCMFYVEGAGIPTFAGATSSTSINGAAGTATVLPLGGAPVQYGHYVLTQADVGSDAWSLE